MMSDAKIICPIMSTMIAVPEESQVGQMRHATMKPMVLRCECSKGLCGFWNFDAEQCGQSIGIPSALCQPTFITDAVSKEHG